MSEFIETMDKLLCKNCGPKLRMFFTKTQQGPRKTRECMKCQSEARKAKNGSRKPQGHAFKGSLFLPGSFQAGKKV